MHPFYYNQDHFCSNLSYIKKSSLVLAWAAHILKLEQYRDEHGPCARMTRRFVKHSTFISFNKSPLLCCFSYAFRLLKSKYMNIITEEFIIFEAYILQHSSCSMVMQFWEQHHCLAAFKPEASHGELLCSALTLVFVDPTVFQGSNWIAIAFFFLSFIV